MGKGFDMGKQILTQIGHNPLSNPLQNHRLQIGTSH